MGRENSLRSRIISLASKRIKKSTWDDDDDLSGNLDAWVLFCFLPGWKQHFVNDIVKSSVFRSSLHFYRLNVKMSSALNFQIWLRIFSRWLSSPNLLPDFRAKTRVENFESKLFWNITQLPRISQRWRALPRPFPTMEKAAAYKCKMSFGLGCPSLFSKHFLKSAWADILGRIGRQFSTFWADILCSKTLKKKKNSS